MFYLSHLAVEQPKSLTTPVRIVFNSSQLFRGVSLNSFLAKGPDSFKNNLLGMLLRFREEQVVLIGDIRKMYNSVHLDILEQHTHRFLWRELFRHINPQAADLIIESSYVDDIVDSVPSLEVAKKVTHDADLILSKGGFKVKGWLFGGDDVPTAKNEVHQVLGVSWIASEDSIVFQVSLNFSPKRRNLHSQPDLDRT